MQYEPENPTLKQKLASLMAAGVSMDDVLEAGMQAVTDKHNAQSQGFQQVDTHGFTRTGQPWEEFFRTMQPLPDDFSVDRSGLDFDNDKVHF